MNLILLSTLESIVESRTRLRADRAGAMILHHTFFLGTGFTFTSISPPVQSAQAAPHQAARFTPPAHLRPGYCTIRAGPQCATKCGTFDMCATSATNVAQNVAQLRPASNDLE